MNKFISLSLTLAVVGICNASAYENIESNPKQALSDKGKVSGIEKLPINALVLVETDQGKTYFVSKNGRFVFQGKLIDTWFRRSIDTVEKAKATHRVPLDKMGIKNDSLATLTLGNKNIPRQATIFVDPYCSYCKVLLNRLMATPDKYHVDLVLAPILGTKSKTRSQQLFCAKNKKMALADLVYQTSLAVDAVSRCETKKLQGSITAMQLLGAEGTPFLVREDGLTFGGLPNDFDKWLEMK